MSRPTAGSRPGGRTPPGPLQGCAPMRRSWHAAHSISTCAQRPPWTLLSTCGALPSSCSAPHAAAGRVCWPGAEGPAEALQVRPGHPGLRVCGRLCGAAVRPHHHPLHAARLCGAAHPGSRPWRGLRRAGPALVTCRLPWQDHVLRLGAQVLVPCYTEDLKIVAETVSAAVEAELPENSTMTVRRRPDVQSRHQRWNDSPSHSSGADSMSALVQRDRPAEELPRRKGTAPTRSWPACRRSMRACAGLAAGRRQGPGQARLGGGPGRR